MNVRDAMNARHETPERAEWLALARQQSRRRVDEQLRIEPPFDWSRVEQPAQRRPRALGLPRLALAGVLVLGSVTWAFVHHRRQASSRAPLSSEMLQRQVGDAGPAPLQAVRTIRRAREAVVQRDVPERRPHQKAKPPVVPPKVAQKSDETAAAKLRPTDADGKVSFGDEVIILTPPATLKPLWTPAQYKRRFGPGFKGRLGPKAPRKGDETLP
ncbi:MAG: hypothetical protein CSA24_01750 [Deltaproteobacteria bacterium]|nr:MAG: hypothetical protein CSA24_01750 [Deltaproteobacteria bacterium]